MVWTIAPAVSGRQRRRVLTLHVAGLLAGAVTMCMILVLVAAGVSALGLDSPDWLRLVVAALLVAWLIRGITRRGLPYPRSRWQVPEQWRARLPLQATAPAYGYLLGLGALTDVVLPTYWLLVGVTVTALGSFWWALVAWLAYGAARGAVTIAGVRHFTATCGIDGAPTSSAVRPSLERVFVTALTVLLFVSVAGSQLVYVIKS
jgi:hypothetical protein